MMKVLGSFVLSAILTLTVAVPGFCVKQKTLYPLFERKSVIKTYIADILNSTGEKKVDLKHLRTELADALKNRRSLPFEIMPKRENSDIQIDIDVEEFRWSETDPVDQIGGLTSAAYDAMVQEHYARMEASITVTDVKKNKVLWKDTSVVATITDGEMSEEDSITMINEHLAKVFIRDAFGRKRGSKWGTR